jgi:hypothetical protein
VIAFKIISTIFIGLLLFVGLWIACYILVTKMYPKYSLQLRHHIFSLLVAIITFVLYCSFSTVSATISGIEYTLNLVKTAVIEKSDVVGNLTAILLSDNDQNTFVNEINNSILETLEANSELDDYTEYIDFSQINTQNITTILSENNLSVKEKTLQIIDFLFETYIREFTRILNRIWWILLLVIIAIQLIYFGIMIYRCSQPGILNVGFYSNFIVKSLIDQMFDRHCRRQKDINIASEKQILIC